MSLRDDICIIHSDATFAHVIDRLHELRYARVASRSSRRSITLGMRATPGSRCRDTRVLIFGNAKAGTALMLASPDVALELPLRILGQSEDDGRTALVYVDPGRLTAEFGIPDLASSISGLSVIAQAAATPVRA